MIIYYDNFYLRKVKAEDVDLLYHWANESEVRRNSLQTASISYDEHIEWFHNKLKSNTSDLFIYCTKQENIGHIRLEYNQKTAVVNFSIDKSYRGKGFGIHMLTLSEDYLKQNRLNITCMNAIVKKENVPSQKVFLKLGYRMEEKDSRECIYFYKHLFIN